MSLRSPIFTHMPSQVLGKENEDGAAFELDLTSLRQVLHLFVDGTTVRVCMALFEVKSKSLVLNNRRPNSHGSSSRLPLAVLTTKILFA